MFIELTRVDEHGEERKILTNPFIITDLTQADVDECVYTDIYFLGSDGFITVKETPEQIKQMVYNEIGIIGHAISYDLVCAFDRRK